MGQAALESLANHAPVFGGVHELNDRSEKAVLFDKGSVFGRSAHELTEWFCGVLRCDAFAFGAVDLHIYRCSIAKHICNKRIVDIR